MSRSALQLLGLGLVASGCACAPRSRAEPLLVPAPTSSWRADDERGAPILSAHWALSDAPAFDGRDGIPLVFAAEVDPMTLTPAAFVVRRSDGSMAVPALALLAPANEHDENRTVLLLGHFADPGTCGAPSARDRATSIEDAPVSETESAEGDPADREKAPAPAENAVPNGQAPGDATAPAAECKAIVPRAVMITGAVYTEDGRRLDGVAMEVEPFDTPGRVVAVERVEPAEGRCGGFPWAVRTYWLDGLRGVDQDDLARIHFTTKSGTRSPAAFDDHDLEHPSAQDNVLDLCLDGPEEPTHLRIEAGVFLDPAGHSSAAVDIEVPPLVPSSPDP